MERRATDHAKRIWSTKFHDQELDKELENLLAGHLPQKQILWLARARKAQLLSTNQVAMRLRIATPSYTQLEKNETSGSIQLKSLRRVAEALDCDLVYYLRPKKHRLFANVIWETLFGVAKIPRMAESKPWHAQASALATNAFEKMTNAPFRREMKWNKRKVYLSSS